jgi:hypothetical protein
MTALEIRNDSIAPFTKQTIIGILIDRSLYESYFIVYLCCTDRPLATQLNMALTYCVTHDLLVSIVDPTGLRRARAYYCGDIPITHVPVATLKLIKTSR